MARYLQNFTGLDADLQRLSAAAPLISIWDDHEGEQAGRSHLSTLPDHDKWI